MLSDHGNGSRMIFTTRSSDLAKSAHHIHEMRLLDEDQTWNLLPENIFEGDPCPFQLEAIGKAIARSCRGHPLSIAVVSGILRASDQTASFRMEHKINRASFPLTLQELKLHGLQLSWEDMKMVASLPNLEVLKLRNYACAGDRWETSEGGFSRLIFLQIEESNLENWITKSSHFPRLWQLVLLRCWSLLEIPDEMADPTLEIINLDDENQSMFRSAKQIQKDRHSLGHDPLYIYYV